MIVKPVTKEIFKEIEGLTKSPKSVKQIKDRFYIDTVESVIWKRYQIASCFFDAFAQNCFYISDLRESNLINDNDEEYLNGINIEFFHKENLKKRGDKNE